jgi:type II secretory pathway pseudopilin PulG
MGYLLVLYALALVGLLLAGAGQVWKTSLQREKETELLFIGHQFRQALRSYQLSSPEASPRYPASLEDLLEDRRFPAPRRHLRKLYRDPITGQSQWGLLKSGDRILGIYSLSTERPLKTSFQGKDSRFAGATSYAQWIFSLDSGNGTP